MCHFQRIVALVVFVVVVSSLQGCKPSLTCEFYVNLGVPSDLVCIHKDGHRDSRTIRPGSVVKIDDWIWSEYEITAPNAVWHYRVKQPPAGYQTLHGFLWKRRTFRAQVEPDGRIFVLRPGQETRCRERADPDREATA